jgi:hypothetical protein
MTGVSDQQSAADRAELSRWSGEVQQQLLEAAMRELPPGCGNREPIHAAAERIRRVTARRGQP